MDSLDHFVKLPTLIFAVVVYLLTLGLRVVMDRFVSPKVKEDKLYADLLLPTMPVLIGALLALPLSKYPFPEEISNWYVRLFYGAVVGLFSGYLYRVIKAVLSKFGGGTDEPTPLQKVTNSGKS